MTNLNTKLLLILTVLFILPTTVISKNDQNPYIEGEVLIKFKNASVSTQEFNISNLDIKAVKQLKHSPITVFKSTSKNTNEIIEVLKDNSSIESIQPNYIYKKATQDMPWGVGNGNFSGVNADLVQNNYNITGNDVVVAILDTGIDYNHVDLAANIWHNDGETNCSDGVDNDGNGYIDDCIGYDFVGADANNPTPDNDPDDVTHGHGTHVAGTVAAVNNTEGIIGVSPNAKLMAVKVMDDNGAGNTAIIIDGIDYAQINGANIINLSLGTESDDSFLKDAIDNAYNNEVVIVAATGNGGADASRDPEVLYPARYNNVIGVGAVDSDLNYADFSNYGPDLNIMAPGVFIRSTTHDDYEYWNGTSMATPHVSGVVALIKERDPNLSPSQIMTALYSYAFDLGATGRDDDFGYGLADIKILFDKYFNVTDVDYDKSLTTTDVNLTLQKSLNLDMSNTTWDNFNKTGDVNCDGTVNTTDAMLLLRKIQGLDPMFDAWCE